MTDWPFVRARNAIVRQWHETAADTQDVIPAKVVP